MDIDWYDVAETRATQIAALRAQLAAMERERDEARDQAAAWQRKRDRAYEERDAAESRVAEARRKAFEEALNVANNWAEMYKRWAAKGGENGVDYARQFACEDIVRDIKTLSCASPVVTEPPSILCQSCGKTGGRVVVARVGELITSRWECPHCANNCCGPNGHIIGCPRECEENAEKNAMQIADAADTIPVGGLEIEGHGDDCPCDTCCPPDCTNGAHQPYCRKYVAPPTTEETEK